LVAPASVDGVLQGGGVGFVGEVARLEEEAPAWALPAEAGAE